MFSPQLNMLQSVKKLQSPSGLLALEGDPCHPWPL
jgi:hypothetical protein